MRLWRKQLGTPILTCLGTQLLLINLLGFLVAFSLLPKTSLRISSTMASESDPDSEAEIATTMAPAAAARTSWFKGSTFSEKTKPLPLLYVMENGTPRHFTVTEWASWKCKAGVWFQDIGLTGFIPCAEELFKLKANGEFARLFDGAVPLSKILTNSRLQRKVLSTLAKHAWNVQDMPDSADIADPKKISKSEIQYQFKGLACLLYKIFAAILAASVSDKESGFSIYCEILNTNHGPLVLQTGTNNPLAAFMSIVLLNNKFQSDPSGSTKDMEDNLHRWIIAVAHGSSASVTLGNITEFLSKVHESFWAIAQRDKDGVYSLNRNLQEATLKALQYTCLRAEKTSPSEELQLAATNFRTAITEIPKGQTFSAFYTRLVSLCTAHIPATSSAPRTAIPSIASVASAAASSSSSASVPALAMSAQADQPSKCVPCCSEALHDVIHAYGFAAVEGALKNASSPAKSRWMCEICCQFGHRKFECTNPPHPNREQKLKEHREARAAQNKKARRRASQQNNASSSSGPQRLGGGGQQQGKRGGSQQNHGNLRITFPNNINTQNGRSVRARPAENGQIQGPSSSQLDEALAAFQRHGGRSGFSDNSGRFEDVTDSFTAESYLAHAAVPMCDVSEPQRIAMPITLLLALTGLLAAQVSSTSDNLMLGLLTVLLPVVLCLSMLTSTPAFSALVHPVKRPRAVVFSWIRSGFTAMLVVAAIFLHLLAGADAARFGNTSAAFMTAGDRTSTVFIDTGCSNTLFCSTERLINVRPLALPVNIGGAVPGSIVADRIGDFPLVLRDEEGTLHMRIIKDCMVSSQAQANLLSHNELRKVHIGVLVPDNNTEPVRLFWPKYHRGSGTSSEKHYVNMQSKHGLIPLPNYDGEYVEISDCSSAAEYLASTCYAFNSTHHQLRPLTEAERWHHRLCHAHPSKIAKLSHNCIGIKRPLAEFPVPCHDCMDANIRRNDLPPPSLRTDTGVWNVDMVDMGQKNLSLGKNRYATIITVADSRYTMLFLHRTKDEFSSILLEALARTPKTPKVLRTDGAGEYMTPLVNQILLERGIRKETSNPDEQFGNGKAETMVASLGRGTRVALLSSGLGTQFWGFAALHWIDVYNHLPHSSLGFKTPWEVEMGSTPDVSWFRPFGCRVTVFRGRDNVEHHKLAPRGEACVYVGLGFGRGQKGWLCWSPSTQRIYCTRNCVFDETFMPMRLSDQRILGYYDTTPRTKMVKQHFGSIDAAIQASEELWDLPFDFTSEFIDPDSPEISADTRPPHFYNQEGDALLYDEDDAATLGNKRPLASEVPPTQPSSKRPRPDAVTPSGGSSAPACATASGGTSASAGASGGKSASTRVSGGTPTSTRASGGTGASASRDSTPLLTSGGANSGVNPSMLSAGDHGPIQQRENRPVLDDNFDWSTLGPRLISDVNNFELTEWLIGNEITLNLTLEFFKTTAPKDATGPWQGFVYDTTKTVPPKARLWIFTSNERHTLPIVSHDGSKLTIRDAVYHTYPAAKTLDDLKAQFLGSDLIKEQRSSDSSDDGDVPQTMGNKKTKSSKSKTAVAPDAPPTASNTSESVQPDARPRRNAAARVAAIALSCMQEALGITSHATKVAHARRAETVLHMRNDTTGCTYAALFATRYVCMMAANFGYKAGFIPPEPRSQRDARTRPDSDQWQNAEERELSTLWEMGTFMLVNRPANYDPLPLHFVYKLKVKDGDFDHVTYKARLVMRGNLQYEDEYGETYAPTARLWSLRTLTAIAAQEGFTLKKFDLTGAFLVADMDRELYVEIPGYAVPQGKALLLKKALYGGRSSGALYSKEITTWLRNWGFKPSSVDETLFRYERDGAKGKEIILLSLYVDDGACATNSEALYKEFISDLQSKYKLSDQGNLEWHLSMKFTRDVKSGTIKIDQKAYIETVLKRFDMGDANERDTPFVPKTRLSKQDCPQVPNKQDVKAYQQLVGSLMYVACATRPDIAYAVNTCAQFMSNPGRSHMEAAKHVLRYLKATKDVGITYSKQADEKTANKLFGYVDADHASDLDDRKSVGGYVLMLNGGAVSWSSRKIKVVAISSFESEWYSASICGCEVKAMRRMLEEIGFRQGEPTPVFEDNAACIYSSEADRPMNPCSKHIDIRVFKLKEFVQEGTLKLVKISSERQVADNLTKPLHKVGIEMARAVMSGEEAARDARARAARARTFYATTI